MRSVALDLGNKITLCEVSGGSVIARATATSLEHLRRWIGPQTAQARVAVEASREAWWVERQLRAWGHNPVIVDTTRVRKLGVGQHGRKTDRIDAEVLARAVEQDRVPRAHLLSAERQVLRMQLGVRRMLVETRAHYITTVRGLARAHGIRIKGSTPEAFTQVVQETCLGDELRRLVEPLVTTITALDVEIEDVNGRLETLCAREPVIPKLMTAPGVGAVVAAAFVSVVDDARRFRNAHELESYVGLVPLEHTSGKRRVGAITKQGNRYLRSLMVQAAWALLASRHAHDPLKQWGLHVLARRGRRVAVVAVARRLVGVLWAMWRDGTVYEATRVGDASAHGLERRAQSTQLQAWAIRQAARKRLGNRRTVQFIRPLA